MIIIDSIEELLGQIRSNGAIIYGIGYVAERFVDGLKKIGLDTEIKFFVTSNVREKEYKGKSVISVDDLDIDDKALVCIATHEAVKNEIEERLRMLGIERYIWIYPYLHELWFGQPIAKNIEVDLDKIIGRWNDYRLAIRALAIDQYYGKNDVGYDIYVKAQSLHCEERTAIKRLERFIELIDSWDKKGYDSNFRPKLSEDYEVLDGAHRITLAYYHGMKTIACDIYHAENAKSFRNDEVDITEDMIVKAGLNESQMLAVISRKKLKNNGNS